MSYIDEQNHLGNRWMHIKFLNTTSSPLHSYSTYILYLWHHAAVNLTASKLKRVLTFY